MCNHAAPETKSPLSNKQEPECSSSLCYRSSAHPYNVHNTNRNTQLPGIVRAANQLPKAGPTWLYTTLWHTAGEAMSTACQLPATKADDNIQPLQAQVPVKQHRSTQWCVQASQHSGMRNSTADLHSQCMLLQNKLHTRQAVTADTRQWLQGIPAMPQVLLIEGAPSQGVHEQASARTAHTPTHPNRQPIQAAQLLRGDTSCTAIMHQQSTVRCVEVLVRTSKPQGFIGCTLQNIWLGLYTKLMCL